MKITLVLMIALGLPTFAQTSVKDAMAKHWKASGEFTIAVANAMPAESYNFRASPEEMTFGQLMAHIGLANLGACANASGMPRPAVPENIAAWQKDQKLDIEKKDAVAFAISTFGFCNTAIAGIPAENWDKVLGPPARNLTGFEWLWSYFTHTAHHRGQAEVYLRVKGIKPPAYVF